MPEVRARAPKILPCALSRIQLPNAGVNHYKVGIYIKLDPPLFFSFYERRPYTSLLRSLGPVERYLISCDSYTSSPV